MSHPSRVRGLKLIGVALRNQETAVAPFTGAWIEIGTLHKPPGTALESHPSRVRGLKLIPKPQEAGILLSHPSRVRGLKYDIIKL